MLNDDAVLKILPEIMKPWGADGGITIDKIFFQTKAEAYLAVNGASKPFHHLQTISPILFLVASMIVIDLL